MAKQKKVIPELEKKLKVKAEEASPGLSRDPQEEKEKRERRTKEEIIKDSEKRILSSEINPLLKPLVKIPFKVWADSQKIPELALTEAEELEFALHVTRILNYYLPERNPVAMMWIGAIGFSGSLILPRIQLISAKRKEKEKKAKEKENCACSLPLNPFNDGQGISRCQSCLKEVKVKEPEKKTEAQQQ